MSPAGPGPGIDRAGTGEAALLVCEDGRVFSGWPYGARGTVLGEVVFATGMTGYQETLTDPSYHRQIVVMTAPQIGNTGMNPTDAESERIQVAGFAVRSPSLAASNHRSRAELADALVAAGVVGIAGLDTRGLTRHLRSAGTMRAGLTNEGLPAAQLLERVRASPGMAGADLAGQVGTREPYLVPATGGTARRRVALLDLGCKRSTPAALAALGCDVLVLPPRSSADELLATDPDGVLVSNGPGDPAAAGYAIEAVAGVLRAGRPLFGICFGHQVLGRALGFDTYKLPFGHRGINQPVATRASGRVAVTSHNHGFAVAAPLAGESETWAGRVVVSHVALNDNVVEGLACRDIPASSVQFHPEAAPGPHDAAGLFAEFVERLADRRTGRAGGWA